MSTADKPITLITATPGGGKTALAVQIMMEAVAAGRPLFVMGIPELTLPYSPTPPINEWTELREDPENPGLMMPYFTFPPNSLIVLDEAQRVFRLRASASKVPEHVAAFETVRHTGVTFLLMTQHPNFVDSHIRNLVGQHIHLRDLGLLGRWFYEWPEVSDPKAFHSAPIKKPWKLPKETFSLYKSSSLHIKRRYTVPPAMMMLAVVVLLGCGGVWMVWSSISKKLEPGVVASAVAAPGVGAPAAQPTIAKADPAVKLLEFVPVVPGRPETAPAYDSVRVVRNLPRVAGCVATASRCRCVNDQGTDAGLDQLQCRRWIDSPPFDAYTDRAQFVARLDDSRTDRAGPVARTEPGADASSPGAVGAGAVPPPPPVSPSPPGRKADI